MSDFSVLIGGKAGEGINKAGQILAHLLTRIGYHVYMYYDYPSLIRGGHNFTIVRAADRPIGAHRAQVDAVLAMNQDTIDMHREKVAPDGILIFDSDYAKGKGMGIPLSDVIKAEEAPLITKNSGMIGAFCKAFGIDWEILEVVLKRDIPRDTDSNLAVARRAYGIAGEHRVLPRKDLEVLPFLTGNEALSLGLIRGGLASYVAYPMTPSSSILHFLADEADAFGIKVIHPENEIAVMLIALGCACGGDRVAVGTSGGGFCLMTEGLSMAGMAEIPIAIVMGQRTGPSTGLPTYTGQTELQFVRFAGQGEFPRFVAAPGDAEEAYRWAAVVLNMAWKYQTPSFLLVDKNVCEGGYTFRIPPEGEVEFESAVLWSGEHPYSRYRITDSGISPFAAIPVKGEVIKINSYYHTEHGITTEDPKITTVIQEKLIRKGMTMAEEVATLPAVNRAGDPDAAAALLCWGSTKGVCTEVADRLGIRMIQPIVLWPFPTTQCQDALKGVEEVIAVEQNATGQLAALVTGLGFSIDHHIHQYDGRPFTVEGLEARVKEVRS